MRLIPQIENERHIELEWKGPYLLRDGKLAEHPIELCPLPGDHPGLYLATGDHPLQGHQALLYIGKTKRLVTERICEHIWLREEWRVELYVTEIEDSQLRDDAEALLIYAHTPAANSSRINTPPKLISPLRIWNRGRFWGLYPEVSSEHDWFRPYGMKDLTS